MKGLDTPMTDSPSISPGENTYIIDAENAAELARLIHQDRFTTKNMGGLMSEQPDLSNIHAILDIACGPGGWALEVADMHRHLSVVGIDISSKMIEYARALAKAQKLENVTFRVMNALQPLDFPDDSFDIVNARFLFAFMLPHAWPTLIQECLRVCRPGGIIRLTEAETPISNSPALEKLIGVFTLALKRANQSISVDGRHAGITTMLERFLQNAGCENVQAKAHVLNFSAGAEAHSGQYQNFMVFFQLLQPFLIKTDLTTPQEFDQLYQEMLRELQEEEFCGIQFFLTAWGKKAQLLPK